MNFKDITFYPEIFIDAAILIAVAVGLILLSKCLWDWKENRRLKKEFAAHVQRREDEAQEE